MNAQPSGAPIPLTSSSAANAAPAATMPESMHQQVVRVLEMIRPAVQSDGGDVELVEVSGDGVVTVRLHGACVGCPSNSTTLQAGIERNLKLRVPGVQRVVALE